MWIMEDSLPNIKSFFRGVEAPSSARFMLVRFMVSILVRHGRNSSMNAASVLVGKPRHRAQPARFLARIRWRTKNVLGQLVMKLLKNESWSGDYILILDSTLVGHQGQTMENTYSTGNRRRRPAKNRRYNKYKYAKKSCHCFVFGLLLTPEGVRIPLVKPLYTKAFANKKKRKRYTQSQLGAQIINELPVPRGVSVTVLGDTAFDAKVIREACDRRNYVWIFPVNANRVFAGKRGERPRVSSRIKKLSKKHFHTIRITSSQSRYAKQRRLSKHRMGSKLKARTYHVHSEKREVHSVGQVMLVFSSTKLKNGKAVRESTKILMTNATGSTARQVVELYSVRWQIELFFKELKSILGMQQYQYKNFDAVEGWIEIVLITFVYLEWTRAMKLKDKRISVANKQIWTCQRAYGIRQAILIGIQTRQLKWTQKRLKSKSGTKTLTKTLTKLLAKEYRCAADAPHRLHSKKRNIKTCASCVYFYPK